MKIGMYSDSLHTLSLEEFLDAVASIGLDYVEFGTGCWSTSPHLNLERLLQSYSERESLRAKLTERGLQISALNCSGNPLQPGPKGQQHDAITRKTIALAEMLNVERVVMMSGCPAAPGDQTPNWITVSWPPELTQILEWQWKEVVIPYWMPLAAFAADKGRRLCLELQVIRRSITSKRFFGFGTRWVRRLELISIQPSILDGSGSSYCYSRARRRDLSCTREGCSDRTAKRSAQWSARRQTRGTHRAAVVEFRVRRQGA